MKASTVVVRVIFHTKHFGTQWVEERVLQGIEAPAPSARRTEEGGGKGYSHSSSPIRFWLDSGLSQQPPSDFKESTSLSLPLL